ncbi:MAG: DUF4276 family protein [Clostridiales bacterium]|nr:DUF4276 family protein [Clostridiales bacterium]
MKIVYIYCEGFTEESFINEILYPYFFHIGIWVRPIVCETNRTASKKYKGGVSKFKKIKHELIKLCKSHKNALITTMFDYYAMPEDTPGINDHLNEPDIFKRVRQIEEDINKDLGLQNCKFHFMLHEFEGILFSCPNAFRIIAGEDVVEKIQQICDSFPTPEHINNSPDTAPSKRLEKYMPNYAKIKNGTLLSKEMGLDVIMEKCPHFRQWVLDIASLSESNS